VLGVSSKFFKGEYRFEKVRNLKFQVIIIDAMFVQTEPDPPPEAPSSIVPAKLVDSPPNIPPPYCKLKLDLNSACNGAKRFFSSCLSKIPLACDASVIL
jgi:hypothetical protein